MWFFLAVQVQSLSMPLTQGSCGLCHRSSHPLFGGRVGGRPVPDLWTIVLWESPLPGSGIGDICPQGQKSAIWVPGKGVLTTVILVILTTRVRFPVLSRTEIPCSGTRQGVSPKGQFSPVREAVSAPWPTHPCHVAFGGITPPEGGVAESVRTLKFARGRAGVHAVGTVLASCPGSTPVLEGPGQRSETAYKESRGKYTTNRAAIPDDMGLYAVPHPGR